MASRKKPRGRTVQLDPTQRELLERQREAFRAKFGRDPGSEDPVFFDPKADDPRPLNDESLVATVVDAIRAAGMCSEQEQSHQATEAGHSTRGAR